MNKNLFAIMALAAMPTLTFAQMKKLNLFIVFALCNMSVFAQSWVDDLDFNRPKHACYINDIFVKDFIGFDMGENSGVTDI